MQSFVIRATTLASLLAFAAAQIQGNTGFGLVLIRSGSPLQYASPVIGADGKLTVTGANTGLYSGYFLPDGRVRQGGTDQWLTVGVDKALEIGTSAPTTFGVDDSDHLTVGGSAGFVAAQNADGTYTLFAGSSGPSNDTTSYNVELRVQWEVSSSSSSSAETSAETETSTLPFTPTSGFANITSPTATAPPEVTETVTQCVEDGDCIHTSVPQVNGAAATQGLIGAAAFALAGALLL